MENHDLLYWNYKLPIEVLRIIFDNLNGRDLSKAAMVCRSWLEAAIEEKRARTNPCCIKIYNNSINKLNEFLNSVKSIKIKPLMCIWFTSSLRDLYERERFVTVLPRHCKVIVLYNYKYLNVKCRQVCLFLPEIPYVKIERFDLSNVVHNNIIPETTEYRKIISTINNHEASMPNHDCHEISTCLMLFCNHHTEHHAKDWASAICESQKNKNFTVFSGRYNIIKLVHNNNWTCDIPYNFYRSMEHSSCIAVLITGLMQTYSIILEKDCKTEEQIEARLQLFKHEIKLKRYSIGIMFAYFIDEKNGLQLKIFEKLFPKVLLIDSVAYDGIFRKTTFIDEVNEERNSKEEEFRFCCCLETVFLIFTYA